MKRASLVLSFLALLAVGIHGWASANPMVSAILTGAAEVAGGDPDGSGEALIALSPGGDELCFDLKVSGIAPATAAHIHKGAVGVNGPVVVTLQAPTSGSSQGCVTVDSKLLKDIQQHPEDYYVNVHNADFPGGAIRGQLSR